MATTDRADGLNAAPLRVLMITGGGWHDYEAQQSILRDGLSERVHVEITTDHEAGKDSGQKISRHENTDWARDFDLVLYNMCFADIRDVEWSKQIVQAHVDHQVPAVVLHCALHSYNYHRDDDTWQRFAGVKSYRHQSRKPFTVEVLAQDHPVMANFPSQWTTPAGELYNIEEVFETATPLAHAYGEDRGRHEVNIWVNEYQGVQVFGTTIGHHNVTMSDPVYLDLVASGLLWSAGKLNADGSPAAGYRPPPNRGATEVN
jgi:type 1 glutamine amidotransferase